MPVVQWYSGTPAFKTFPFKIPAEIPPSLTPVFIVLLRVSKAFSGKYLESGHAVVKFVEALRHKPVTGSGLEEIT
jgi:hypothetical protein